MLLIEEACCGALPARCLRDGVVPVPPAEHERLHYFGRRDHHLVPGTVTIGGAPYVCDLDRQEFADRDLFLAHIRSAHRVRPGSIRDRLVIRDQVVHFIDN